MNVIRTGWPHDLPALRDLFARANDAPYPLEAVTEEKCFVAGFSGPPTVRLFVEEERILGAAVVCGHYLRLLVVDRERRREGIGSALLRDAESLGIRVVAAEGANYFTPGIAESDRGSILFFHHHRYRETRWTWNLHVGLERLNEPAPARVRRPRHDESDRILSFIDDHFGRIWRYEVSRAFECDVPSIYVAEEGDQIRGFAAHDVNNRGLGFFGPTGVATEARGQGHGSRLLQASLADLKRLGYARAVIPWTDAVDFYRKASGAEAAHRFVAFANPQP